MKIRHFYDPVLTVDVTFITESTPQKIEKYLTSKKKYNSVEGFDTTAGSLTLLDDVDSKGRKTREYLLIVEDKKGFYTLLHECLHLAMHILDDRGIPVRMENTEILAYYQTFWFKKLWRSMNNIEVVLRKRK